MTVKRNLIAVLAMVCLIALSCVAFVSCKDEQTYTLTYASGATDATGTAPKVQEYKEGEKVTLLASDTFKRDGYTFTAWNDGENDYTALQEFVMPAKNVTMTAKWKKIADIGEKDIPTLTELDSKFYTADNWGYMTNNGGTSLDGGDVPFSLADGSIKFHRANQAINLGSCTNGTMSFMLKGTNDWSIWLNSDSIDNRDNNSYRLAYKENKLGIAVSSVSDNLAAVVSQSTYQVAEWNRIDIVFATENNACSIKLYVNGERASLVRGNIGTTEEISVSKNVLKHTQGAEFETGNYAVVKVWEAHNFLQIKPVSEAETKDVKIIACIGASITEGAGANNFYTESYPAQLQQRLGANYNVINFGNSGKTVREDLTDGNDNSVAWLAQYQWQGVQKVVPDMAILNIGTNDSKTSNEPLSTFESFKTAYNHLLDELLTVNPQMEIYICTVPTAYTNIWGISEENINQIIAPVQREIATERGFTLIDLYEYSKNKSLLFGDGVHPNTHGYTMFVDIIEEVLTGDGTLSKEFLDEIDAKYNDNGKIENVSAVIAEESGKLYLTVSGDTSLTASGDLKVYVGDGKSIENYYPADIAEGKFTAKIDLATLKEGNNWFNVRVYSDEYSHRIVLLNNTTYAGGDKFVSDEVQAIVRTWNTNWGASFSFTVDENYKTEVASASITVVEGKLTLSVSGTTNASTLQLFVGQKPDDDTQSNFSVDATVTDKAFNATFDLTKLNNYEHWYNVRIYHEDGSYVPVGYKQTTDGEHTLEKNDVFYCADTIITIVSWSDGGVDTLSFEVKANDGTNPVIKLTDATLDVDIPNGTAILTVSGNTRGTKPSIHAATLLYLGNDAGNAANFTALTEDANGNWSGSVDLAQLAIGTKYEIRIYTRNVDGNTYGGYYTLKIGDVKSDGNVVAANTEYEFADKKIIVYDDESTWDPFRIKVTDTTVPELIITATSIVFNNQYLVVEGTATGNIDSLVFALHNDKNMQDNIRVNATITDGAFNVQLDLTQITLSAGSWLYLYYNVNDGVDTKVEYQKNDTKHIYENRQYRFEYWEGIAIAYSDYTPVDTSFSVSSMRFEEGKFIVEGTCGASITRFVIHLHNTNSPVLNYEKEATISDGTFRVEFVLSEIKNTEGGNPPKTYINVRYEINDDGYKQLNLLPETNGSYVVGQEYRYENRTWTLKADPNRTYLNWSEVTDKYRLTDIDLAIIDGRPTLSIVGTTTEAIAADQLTLLLDKTTGTTEKKTITNNATEAGNFSFTIDLSDLIASVDTTDPTKQQAYFIRLYNGDTKLADLNSRWASDMLWERAEIETDTARYFLMKNTVWSSTGWNTLGIVKVEK